MNNIIKDQSNRDIIEGFREYGDYRYRFINHQLWDILINILDTFIYHIYPYNPESFQSHISSYYS
jgi:hypothetical protein